MGQEPLHLTGHGMLFHAPFKEKLMYEASQENSLNARARIFRTEGIWMPGSKEAKFFRGFFYRIPCVGVSLRWEMWAGLVVTAPIAVSAFACMRALYGDKSYNAVLVIGAVSRCRSALSRFSSLWSPVCL